MHIEKRAGLKTYSDTLKKHLYSILDYAKVEFFYPSHALEQLTRIAHIKQVGSNSLQMVL